MIRLFCSTVYVFTPDGKKCLLVNHKKLQCWVPPGGKIDPNELPDDAAIRECLEETGVKVRLIGECLDILGGLIGPRTMQLNVVIPGQKEHIDFVYIAVADTDTTPLLNPEETHGVEWFAIDRIISPEFKTFDSVKTMVKLFGAEIEHTKNSPL